MTTKTPDGPRAVRVVVQDAAPSIGVDETRDAIVVSCDVRGARREDVRIEVGARRVVIAVLAPLTFPMRRVHGVRCAEFERAVQLPCEVRPEGANVRLEDGVLTIILPKKTTQ